jgi:hypothetical protein
MRAKITHKSDKSINFFDHRTSVSDPDWDSIRLVDSYPDPDP